MAGRAFARLSIMLAAAAISGQALAEEGKDAPPPETVQQIVGKFLDENKTCIDFTDGCSICTR